MTDRDKSRQETAITYEICSHSKPVGEISEHLHADPKAKNGLFRFWENKPVGTGWVGINI